MKLKFLNMLKQGYNLENPEFFSDNFDPNGSYTGNYLSLGEDYEPEQDVDDL